MHMEVKLPYQDQYSEEQKYVIYNRVDIKIPHAKGILHMQLSIKSSKNEKKKLLNFLNKNKIHLINSHTITNHYFSKKENLLFTMPPAQAQL